MTVPNAHEARLAKRRRAVQHWFDGAELADDMPRHAAEVVQRICHRVLETGESFRHICNEKTVADAPSYYMLVYWRSQDPRIAEALLAARAARAEARWESVEEEISEILDVAGGSGSAAEVRAAQAKAKMMIDIRKFEVTKLVPAIYGERGRLLGPESKPGDPERPPATIIEIPAKNAEDVERVETEESA